MKRTARTDRPRGAVEPLERRAMLSVGALDPSFGTLGALAADFGGDGTGGVFGNTGDSCAAVLVMPGDKVLLVGTGGPPDASDFALARFNADGTPDTAFGRGGADGDGRVTADFGGSWGDYATAATLQGDGKILVAGVRINTGSGGGGDFADGPVANLTTFDYDVCLARYDPGGTPDPTFGVGGKAVWVSPTEPESAVHSVAALPGGDILVSFGPDVMRFSPTGTLLQTVNTGLFLDYSTPVALSVLPSGKVLVAGYKLGRLNADLSLDRTFGGGDGVETLGFHAGAVRTAPDGKVVIVGGIGDSLGRRVTSLARFTADGRPDRTFGGGDGFAAARFVDGADFAADVAFLPDGSILVPLGVGPFDQPFADAEFSVARFNHDGSVDTSFGDDGRLAIDRLPTPASANALALDSAGRVVVAGSAMGNFAAARLIVGPVAGSRTYEAEQARLSGAVVSRAHAGFTGGGFVDYRNASGDFAEWTVDAPSAGVYWLTFRFANASATDPRAMRLDLNGRAVTNAAFPSTGAWTAWRDTYVYRLSLPAGMSRVRLTAIGHSGPNIDSLTVQPDPRRHEAESATVSGAVVSRGHGGYTGDGYVDYQHARGDLIEWAVDAPADGFYLLEFDYANGAPSPRTMQLAVNNQIAEPAAVFGRTGSWSTWATVGFHLTLKKGLNRIRLLATGQSGPNVDALSVTMEDGSTT
jgi:uncharacterized delta-60 repeat protein